VQVWLADSCLTNLRYVATALAEGKPMEAWLGVTSFKARDGKLAQEAVGRGAAVDCYLAQWGSRNVQQVAEVVAPLRAPLLLSFHYFRDHGIADLFADCDPMPRIFLDSGAFSAATKGVKIDVGEYAAYIERNLPHIEVYANLDVIGDHKRTRANQRYLEKRGLHPLSVFHAHEPWEVLRDLVGQYAYIGLGGIAIKRTQRFAPWIKQCFGVAGDTKLHGFGVSNWMLLRAFPWHSVDHTSWGSGFRFGAIPVFDSRRGCFVKVDLRDRETAWRHSRLLYDYGFSPNDAALWTKDKRPALCKVAALSWMRAAQWLTEWHQQHDTTTKEINVCPH
jgi:hypothetical protein